MIVSAGGGLLVPPPGRAGSAHSGRGGDGPCAVGVADGEDSQSFLGSLFQAGASSGEEAVADRADGMGFHTVLRAGRLLLSVDSQGVRHQGERTGVGIVAVLASVGFDTQVHTGGGLGGHTILMAKRIGNHIECGVTILAGIAC